MNRQVIALLALIAWASVAPAQVAGTGGPAGSRTGEAAAFRTWTMADGKTVEAEVVEIDAKGVVTLKNRADQVVKTPLAQLSEADRALLGALRPPAAAGKKARLTLDEKLDGVVIPKVECRQSSVETVVDFLRDASGEFSPDKTPINIVLHPSAAGTNAPVITMNLSQVKLREALGAITTTAGLKYSVEGNVVMITGAGFVGPIIMRTYTLTTVGAAVIEEHWGKEKNEKQLTSFFANLGVAFPEGGFVSYDPKSRRLLVRNTAENFTAVEAILKQINVGATGK